jgi:CheY-like chemotaxis protein
MATVLVVDDALFMRKVISDAVVAGGHEVVGEATNGREAVARFKERRAARDHRARSCGSRGHVLRPRPGT